MKINMTIDECIEYADEWSRGMTYHEDSQGWRVVCMLLAEEVRRLRGDKQPSAIVRFYDTPDGTVGIEVEHVDGYKRTKAQIIALQSVDLAMLSTYRKTDQPAKMVSHDL